LIQNLCQRGTSQRTVTANELCTKALLRSCSDDSEYVLCGVDGKATNTDKQTEIGLVKCTASANVAFNALCLSNVSTY